MRRCAFLKAGNNLLIVCHLAFTCTCSLALNLRTAVMLPLLPGNRLNNRAL
uniref:Uncharacterized protein n=1 Tax=Anguilla anguilla TaxID=7936 RepID=A0A0E9WEE9_ANGAN